MNPHFSLRLRSLLLSAGLFSSIALPASAQIYQETFNNSEPAGNLPITTIGWIAYRGSPTQPAADITSDMLQVALSGVLGRTQNAERILDGVSQGPAVANGFLIGTEDAPTGTALGPNFFVYTPSSGYFDSLTFSDFNQISFYEGNARADITVQVAIQIDGGQWYLSTQTFSSAAMSAANFQTSAEFKSLSVLPTAANWNLFTATIGSPFAIGATPGADLSGTVTGIGFYAVRPTGQTFRLDTLSVAEAVPEPSSIAMLLVGGIGMVGLHLRRRLR